MNKRYQEILALAQNGKIDEALTKCERVIKKNPRIVDYLMLAASLHAQTNNLHQTVNFCKRSLKIDAKNINALYNISIAYLMLEDYENTVIYSKRLLTKTPKNAKALSNLATAYWKLGDYEKAKISCLDAIKYEPHLASSYNNLGLIYKSLNNAELATNNFNQAIELNPNLAEAHYNLGITLVDNEDDTGYKHIETALKIQPDYPEAYNYMGLKQFENKQFKQAIQSFKNAIKYNNNYFEAYCNLGNVYTTEKEFFTAENMYRKAIEINPNYANAYNNLANVLLDQSTYRQNFKEAEQHYLKAIEIAPKMTETYKHLAVCYQGQGKHEDSLKYFTLYNEMAPDDKENMAISSMASVMEHQGRFEEALALIEPYLQDKITSPLVTLAYSKLAKNFKREKHSIEKLLNIDDNTIDQKLLVEKYFSLGKLSESIGTPESTFFYYKKANDLDSEEYDFKAAEDMFATLKAFFSKDKMKTLKRSNNQSDLPIFIVGMPRSGTSLTEQILSSHTDVYGAGELEDVHFLTEKIYRELKCKKHSLDCLVNISSLYATKKADDYLEKLQSRSKQSSRITDKMPHNFLALGLINLIFPNATVIHCVRSSIDTCLSIYFQHFNKDHAYSNNLTMLGRYFKLYADLMDHWKNTLDLNIIEVQYEEMIANPESEIKRLLENCSLDWQPACLDFHKNKRTVMTPSYDQVRRPIYKGSVARWKKYEKNLSELIEALGTRAY